MRLLLAVVMLVLGGSGCGDNRQLPDAGPPDGMGPTEVLCEVLPPISSGTCEVAGAGGVVLLRGNVLTPTTMYRGGQVAVDGSGMIACVGCDCASSDAAATATRVDCAGAVISPGLINPHDHITFTEGKPIDHGATRYDHRHDWRGSLPAPQNPNGGDGTRWGEVRMMLGGVTSIVGAGYGRTTTLASPSRCERWTKKRRGRPHRTSRHSARAWWPSPFRKTSLSRHTVLPSRSTKGATPSISSWSGELV